MNSLNKNDNTKKYYIVQYQIENDHKIFYEIFKQNGLVWLSNNTGTEEVFVVNGNALQLAHIMYIAESREEAQKQLQTIKMNDFKLLFASACDDPAPPNSWMLLQYTESSDKIVYGVWNKTATMQETDKLIDEFITYINIGGQLKQAIILDQSFDLEKIKKKLKCLKRNATKDETPNAMGINLDAHIKMLEKTMQKETTMISEAFSAVDAAKTYLKQKLDFLNGLSGTTHT